MGNRLGALPIRTVIQSAGPANRSRFPGSLTMKFLAPRGSFFNVWKNVPFSDWNSRNSCVLKIKTVSYLPMARLEGVDGDPVGVCHLPVTQERVTSRWILP